MMSDYTKHCPEDFKTQPLQENLQLFKSLGQALFEIQQKSKDHMKHKEWVVHVPHNSTYK